MSELSYTIAPAIAATSAPPIPKARAWAQEYLASSPSQPLLDLSQGVPRDPPHPLFLDSLAKVTSDPSSSKYGPILGEPTFRSAFAATQNELYRLPDAISPADVGITTGCNMAFLVVLMALCPPNTSSVIVPAPAYFNYAMSMSLQSVKPAYIPCDPDRGFVPSLSAARRCLEDAHGEVKPRMILLTTPSNPTGSVFAHEQLKEWFDLAKEFKVALVLDETYRDFVEGEDGQMGVPHGLFGEKDWRSTLVSLGSFSKGYRIPGHRLGSIVADPRLLEHITTICDCMQICAPKPPQLALAPILPSIQQDILASSLALTNRRHLFKSVVEAVPGWRVASMGGYYAYVSFPRDYLHASSTMGLKRKRLGSEDIAKILAKRCGVIALPGAFFMPPLHDDEAWDEVVDGAKLREDRWIRQVLELRLGRVKTLTGRFAVANVVDDDIKQLGDRLRQLNETMGMTD